MPNTDQILSKIIAKTDEYLHIPSVVGHEKPFLDALFDDYQKMGKTVLRDDNIVAVSGKHPESFILTAHIDRHGIVSIGNGDYRYAAHTVKNYKYDEDTTAKLSQLEKLCTQFEHEEVYAYGRWSGKSVAKGQVRTCGFCAERANLIFNIENMPKMPEGIPVAYAHGCLEEDGYIAGQIDNAISVGLIYGLFEAGFEGTAIFTAEEEIGKSWKHLGSFLHARKWQSQKLIVLDTSPYDKQSYVDEGYVVLRNRDSTSKFNQELTNRFKDICQKNMLPFDVKDETLLKLGKTKNQLGRTELGRLVHEYDGRWNGTTLQIPTFNYHTNNETTTRKALSNVFAVLQEYCIA